MTLKKIDKYQIIQKIGEGGMGAVYKAAHPTLKRPVILKQLTIKQSPMIIERFKREARIMLDLRNEHIVQVYDHFKEGNSYFIVMEYVNGISLDKLIREKRYFSNEASLLIFLEVCKGLKYAHDKGIIHRDIKPGNVLISKEGEVKLVDFGIATSKEDEEVGLTKAGATLGTPVYMSPEQISNPQAVDKRADIYAMGVLLYNMTTGKLPYPVNIMPQTIIMIEKGKYVRPADLNPKIMPILQSVIKKCMQPKKNNRYKDLHFVINKLEKKLKGGFNNQKVINHAIKNYIEGKDINFKINKVIREENKKAVIKFPKMSRIFITAFIVLGIILFSLFKTGYIYDYIFSGKIGAFEINVDPSNRIPLKVNKQIVTNIYRKDIEGKFQTVNKDTGFSRIINKSSDFVSYRSNRIYLESGYYKLEIDINNEKYNKEFYLAPRAVQEKTNGMDKGVEIINVDYASVPVLPLNINFNFTENITNAKLDDVSIKIFSRAKWFDWDEFKKMYSNELVSGTSYNFMFIKDGYLYKKMIVNADPYQTVLNVNADLIKVPGYLFIKSNDSNTKVLINDSNYYLEGGENTEYKNISVPFYKVWLFNMLDQFSDKKGKLYTKLHIEIFNEKRLLLSPGSYKIKVIRYNFIFPVVQEKNIDIYGNGRTNLNIVYDSNTKSLVIK